MILIIGGAYQGKLEYAKAAFSLKDSDIFTCTGKEVDLSRKCVYALEEFCFACVQAGEEPADFFRKHRQEIQNSILICQDIFCGVVPMGADVREWRQATGRLCQYLAAEADQVIRIFCGLEQKLK